MRKIVLLTVLALGCAGCTQDSGRPSGAQFVEPGAQAHGAWGSSDSLSRAVLAHRKNKSVSVSFANLADRGDLVVYPAKNIVRRDGAYTWNRADISEAHAMRATLGGTLHITAPSGEKLDFVYERHVEHPSGDWTWIGKLKNGTSSDEAILTFGERAAFGSIAQSGGKAPLKLTVRDGVAWLVETDRSMIAGINNPATRPTGPDFLIPPKLASGSIGSQPEPVASSIGTAAAEAAASTTVDVLLGYTSGFAAGLGGQSQAVTRLNNMVEAANQAYANSQVDARIRLVHAMQVNFADNTDNGDALEKLTGYKSGTGTIPVDPAFTALRAARDQYGADLVSLVRKFNTPENDGCGIAWLIGGGQSGIDSGDAPFGYSVVSDGVDAGNDGKNYFCRDETLAHELGHNMGSQHDRVTATENGSLKYGVYPYSFGYKTAAGAGNFYTVMAYGDSGQTSYRTFSNPRTTFCGGFACGQADIADNARSLGQTMPIVATFRATVVTPEPPVQVSPGTIVGMNSKCLDAYYPGTELRTPIQVWSCNGGRQQSWLVNPATASLGSYGTTRVLDVIGFGTADGTRLQLWDATGYPNQSWYFANFAIVSYGGKVFDAEGMSSANGTKLQLWDDNGGAHQRWQFDPRNGWLQTQNGKCLDVEGLSTANGTPVQLWTCAETGNQKWRMGANGTIRGFGNKCLTVVGSASANGSRLQMWDCQDPVTAQQVLRLRGEIRSVHTNKCLDDPGVGQTNGALVHMVQCHGGANQRWEYTPQ